MADNELNTSETDTPSFWFFAVYVNFIAGSSGVKKGEGRADFGAFGKRSQKITGYTLKLLNVIRAGGLLYLKRKS